MKVRTIFGALSVPVVLAVLVWSSQSGESDGARESITVFAAASLTDALGQIARVFEAATDAQVRTDFGSSGSLRMKIEAGARADLFVSASVRQMESLQRGRYLAVGTLRTIARNELVCVVPIASTLVVATPSDLRNCDVRRVAIGSPDHVPAGIHAKRALTRLGLWRELEPKLVPCQDVRAALAHAERQTVDVAIVYITDMRTSDEVRLAFAFSEEDAGPIVYPAGILRSAPNRHIAQRFLDFLTSKDAERVLAEHGFLPVAREVQ